VRNERLQVPEMRSEEIGYLGMPAYSLKECADSPSDVGIGDNHQVSRRNSEHVFDNPIDVIIAESIPISYECRVRPTDTRSEVAEQICVRVFQGLDVLCWVRINDECVVRVTREISYRLASAKRNTSR
jgi:hypothetical protein